MEGVQRQNFLEFSSVRGVVYVSIDQQPCIVQRFTNCVKAWVILDEESYSKHDVTFSNTASTTIGLSLSKDDEMLPLQPELENGPEVTSSSFEAEVDGEVTTKRLENDSISPIKQCDQTGEYMSLRNSSIKNIKQKDSKFKDEFNYLPKKDKTSRMQSSVMDILPGNSPGLEDENFSLNAAAKTLHTEGKSNSHVSCKYCLKDFKNQQEFYDHRKSIRKEHICDVCQKVFPFKAYVLVHKKSAHDKPVTEHSKQSDLSFGLKNDHRKMCQTSEESLKRGTICEVCGTVMANNCILKTHMMLHTGENAYKCCVCDKEFNSLGSFTHHMVSHEKTGSVQCKICNLGFDSRTELSKHQLIHGSQCSLCGVSFPNKTSRAFHYREYHKEEILKCHKCQKLFSSDMELKAHLKYHRNRKKTQCTVCGCFVSRLNDHMLSHSGSTTDASVYVCDKCPKVFVKKLSFQRHLKIHSEDRPYKCLHCPKKFSRSGGLSRHMLIHCQDKPFVCPVCGRKFTQKGHLKSHMLVHKDSLS